MPYLFQEPPAIHVSIAYHDSSAQDVLLPQDLWDTLLPYSEPNDGRIALKISLHTKHDTLVSRQEKPGVICWGRSSDTQSVTVPRAWLQEQPALFQSEATQTNHAYRVTTAHPVCLRNVVLQPLTSNASSADGAALVDWLATSRPIVHLGGTLYVPHRSDHASPAVEGVRFVVRMMEPAKSGYIDKTTTRVVMVQPNSHERNGVHANGAASHSSDEDEESVYDIDERFLSNMLDSRVNSDVRHISYRLSPLPREKSQEDAAVYVRTADLGEIGVLDGDWVLARSQGNNRRLLRIFANGHNELHPQTVYASPVIVFNMQKDAFRGALQELTLHPTPFGPRRPAVPTARSVTIARIASPVTTNRAFQPYFLQSLQQYFQGHSRLIKQGDIIVLPLDTDAPRGTWQNEDKADVAHLKVGLGARSGGLSGSANEVVHFMVTNLEHDVLSTDAPTTDDILSGSTMGEYGCWVDPAVTRIVQTGVEHSRVPNVASYFGLASSSQARASNGYEKLLSLCSAALARNAVELELQISIILKGARGTGKLTAATQVARKLGLHLLEVNCYNLIGDSDAQTEGTLRARFERAAACSPCLLVLRHIDALSQTTQSSEAGKVSILADAISACIKELPQAWRTSGFPVLVLATSDYPDQTASGLLACFKHEIEFHAPDEHERSAVIRSLLTGVDIAPDVSVDHLATQTAALVASDLVDLVARGEHVQAKKAAAVDESDGSTSVHAGTLLTASDLEVALNNARTSYSESIGAPKIPTVSWDDVGGLANVKKDILDTVQLPLEHPELFASGLKKRSGILLYGPPGTGKTLLAKAVATSCNLNFFSVKGPELLNMYIGESEANVRRVFQRARDAKPCVIFFDELDSVAPKRGNHGDSGGVMDRIVSQLLAELDGVAAGDGGADVFVIGATNRPDLLDAALLRPGRFDRMLYLGVSQTHVAQLNILQALTRKFKLHPDLDLRKVAESCPFHYTGADFYALCSDALLKAMSRKAEEVEAKIALLNAGSIDPAHPYPLTPQYYLAEMASPEDIDVLVSQEDFELALRDLIPSVSQAEMGHYARVQQQFSRETINSDNVEN